MENQNYNDIFRKYAAGECTDEERAIVEGWYLSELTNTTDRPSAERIAIANKRVWGKLQGNPKKVVLWRWSLAAAVISMLIGFAYFNRQHTAEKVVSEAAAVASQQIKRSAEVAKEVVFHADTENTMMKLPDGSVVILAKGSQLTLLAAFNRKHNREVELQGKAFFDIAHNPSKPFIIYTGNVQTTVLGTAFDITTTPGKNTVKVNVIRGLVEVKNKISSSLTHLVKNMQVVFGDNNNLTVRRQVNAEQEMAWKKQDLEFNDISLQDAIERLEEGLGYKILVRDPALLRETFTYSMRSKESAPSFMKSFSQFLNAEYVINEHNRTISIEPLKP